MGYAVAVCPFICPSVCLSVRLSRAAIVPLRLHIGSRKQRRRIAKNFNLLKLTILAKFQWRHPHRGREIEVGGVLKSAIFDQYLAVSQKRDKDIVTMQG